MSLAVLAVMSMTLMSCLSVNFGEHGNNGVDTTPTQVAQSNVLTDMQPFEEVDITGAFKIIYEQGDRHTVRIEASEQALKEMTVYVKDYELRIRPAVKKPTVSFADVKVFVTSPDIIEVSVSGSGDFKSDQRIDTDNLRVELKGSGDISLADIICDHLSTSLVGSGDVRIDKVVAQSSAIEMVGSGDLKINHENVANTNVLLKGSGDIKVDFADGCNSANCELYGSGDIELKGSLRHLSSQKRGSGDIDIDKLYVGK